jgi:2-dehydropantoate 2-reductase
MPDGRSDARLDLLRSLLSPSGIDTTVTTSIRDSIWAKLISNAVGGSLGVLTASATKDVMDKPSLSRLATAMANEAATVAKALGADPGDPAPIVAKLATSSHVQSVVQDLVAGRQMEIDALFRAPLDLAGMAGLPTPYLELVVELVTQRARATGQYHDALKESHASGQ